MKQVIEKQQNSSVKPHNLALQHFSKDFNIHMPVLTNAIARIETAVFKLDLKTGNLLRECKRDMFVQTSKSGLVGAVTMPFILIL